ncbi:MAG: CRISPR-associated endonuclease Cas1 [Candidatus Saccharimonadales bacterium]
MQNKKPYKSRRVPVWLPYLKEFSVDKKNIAHFVYNGGEEHIDIDTISTLMIYGENECTIKTSNLEKIVRKGVPIVYHRRNIASSIYFTSGVRPDPSDTLTAQLLARQNKHKQKHIARALLHAKFHSSKWLVPNPLSLALPTA